MARAFASSGLDACMRLSSRKPSAVASGRVAFGIGKVVAQGAGDSFSGQVHPRPSKDGSGHESPEQSKIKRILNRMAFQHLNAKQDNGHSAEDLDGPDKPEL